jgi:hypothetical protein
MDYVVLVQDNVLLLGEKGLHWVCHLLGTSVPFHRSREPYVFCRTSTEVMFSDFSDPQVSHCLLWASVFFVRVSDLLQELLHVYYFCVTVKNNPPQKKNNLKGGFILFHSFRGFSHSMVTWLQVSGPVMRQSIMARNVWRLLHRKQRKAVQGKTEPLWACSQ